MNRTTNVIELASIYSEAEAIWWMKHDCFPSKAKYRSFTANVKKWNKWIDENINILTVTQKIKPNEKKISLNNIIGTLKRNPSVILSWSIGSQIKGTFNLHDLLILYSPLITPEFDLSLLDEELSLYKIDEEKKSQVYMVVQRHGGLDLQSFDIEIPTVDIEMNYGKEWKGKHEDLIEILTNKKKKGIALLHGLPGTGKSMYIRHLISYLCDRKTVVYLPNQLIPCITDPGFIPLMAEYSGSILVIEDADEAIKSRKNGGGTVDKLLNLADGILSDFLGMQIICTFNSDITTIDEALLRKGRLILKHEFTKLSIEDSQRVSDHLGFESKIEDEMTLAEIYNQEDTLSDIKDKIKNLIGFGR